MRILLINRFFHPDESATAMLATDLAEDLVKKGHEAHVACARLSYDGQPLRSPALENWRGVVIHRLPSLGFGRSNRAGRALDLASFHASLHWFGPRLTRPDLVLCMTDPPLALGAGARIARIHGARLVQHTMDVYPEIAVALGAIRRDAFMTRHLTALDRRWLARCDGVIVLGEIMADRLAAKGVPARKILTAPPWADPERLHPVPVESNPVRRELGLASDDLALMYSGNFGLAHEFDTLLALVRQLVQSPRWHLVLAGGGAQFERVVAESRAIVPHGRLHLLEYAPRGRLAARLSAGDLHVITQSGKSLGLVVPSKLAGVLASGRPVLFIGPREAEVARHITGASCGFVIDPASDDPSAGLLDEFANDPALRASMRRDALALFKSKFSRPLITSEIARWLSTL